MNKKNGRNNEVTQYRNRFSGEIVISSKNSPTKVIDGAVFIEVINSKRQKNWMRKDSLEATAQVIDFV